MNFWKKLLTKGQSSSGRKKPILILAPMEGVTDTVFRQIVTSVGKPSVYFTEFVPVDALLSKGENRALQYLKYSEIERPIVAQIWGKVPDHFFKAAKIIKKLGFDGIDINMGCPDRHVVKNGCCSALIKDPKLTVEIINATIKGSGGLPVSVKTRIGFREIDTENWVKVLLQTNIKALTLHLRTVSEMSKVPAHWDEIKKAVDVRKQLGSKVLIIGNGDIKSLNEAKEKSQKYGIDGVMIGRGIFENVWMFNEKVNPENITPKQKIELLIKHLKLFKSTWKNSKNFALMKKFVKCYINNFSGASEKREILMQTKNIDELIKTSKNTLLTSH